MPLYSFSCPWGHHRDVYVPHWEDQHHVTVICGVCGEGMPRALSVGRGLTWIEEARPLVLRHLSHEPVTVRSWSEWATQVRAHGCEWVGAHYGEKGCWV